MHWRAAFRAVQEELKLDEVYVLGTNCADNSPTPEAAQNFVRNGLQIKTDNILGYEFMQDFKVHVKTGDSYVTKPYFCLPGSIAESSIAPSCLACFDYTNGLADVVIGYMGAPLKPNSRMDESFQTLTIRNERGATMVQAAVDASRLRLGETATGEGSHEKLASATVGSDSIVMAVTGGDVKESGMPGIIGEIMAFAMRNIGPKGINFARYSIDYHIIRNYLHVLDAWGEDRAKVALPAYARDIVNYYLKSDEALATLESKITSKDKLQQ
jgi:coenzyme F420-reducing hydrogenase beta subunit